MRVANSSRKARTRTRGVSAAIETWGAAAVIDVGVILPVLRLVYVGRNRGSYGSTSALLPLGVPHREQAVARILEQGRRAHGEALSADVLGVGNEAVVAIQIDMD